LLKITKKFLTVFLLLLMLTTINFASSSNVVDEMNFLNDSEIDILQEKIDEIKTDYLLELVIVITDNTNSKTSMDFSDDYFDYNDYGIGNERDGILMLINMDARELWLSTSGSKTIDTFAPYIDEMVNFLIPNLKNEDYYTCCNDFLNLTTDKLDSLENTSVPNLESNSSSSNNTDYVNISSLEIEHNETFLDKILNMLKSPIPYVIAIIAGLIPTIIITLSSKGKVTINNRSYETKNSFSLTKNIDRYERSHTSKRKIETNNNSSNSHTSSSGRSHGGGGGSF